MQHMFENTKKANCTELHIPNIQDSPEIRILVAYPKPTERQPTANNTALFECLRCDRLLHCTHIRHTHWFT